MTKTQETNAQCAKQKTREKVALSLLVGPRGFISSAHQLPFTCGRKWATIIILILNPLE